jgi:hypothetical protein
MQTENEVIEAKPLVDKACSEASERTSTNAGGFEISEAMKAAVANVVEPVRRDGKTWGTKERKAKMTPKMTAFASNVAQGMSPREAYAKAYNASGMSHASMIAEANRLMKDPRISVLMETVWESVQQNIIDDAVATRRKVMSDLLAHADDEKARTSDRLKALELVGRAIGMFTDKTETKIEQVDAEQLKRDLDKHLATFGKSMH